MNRIFVAGDTHGGAAGDLQKLHSSKFDPKLLDKEDYVIILGDFGLIWDANESSKSEAHTLKWLADKPWTTLFVDGNHENFDRIDQLETVKMFGEEVGKVNDSIFHLRRGYVYTIAEKKIFTFGGGFSIDKAQRQEHISWWRQEAPSEAEYSRGLQNLEKVDNVVDYILTHTCSTSEFGEIHQELGFNHKIAGEEQLREYLQKVLDASQYKAHCFAHFHADFDLVRHRSFLLYSRTKELL